ncbi:hypothetical protein DXG01_007812 [Tephrocybe rancida]|nr:hypothetical protein DXG01_007812 [Tephrocybe rancida]
MAWAYLLLFTVLSHTVSTLSTPVLQLDASQAVFERPAPKYASASGLPVPNSTHSFWINTPGANPLAKEGSEGSLTLDADVCIIGSGITGVSAAYRLAKTLEGREGAQVKAVILDARDFCSGATGRNGGHMTAVPFKEFVEREQKYGREQAKKSYALENYTTSELVKIIKGQGWEDTVDLVSSEHVRLLMTNLEVEQAKQDFAAARAAGLDLTEVGWLSSEDVESAYGASFPAFTHPGNNVWPLKLVTRLFQLAQALNPLKFNLKLHTNTPVTAISTSTSDGRRWTLSTPRGAVQCSYVLHATNGYTSYLLPHLHGPAGIVPTRGQVMAMRAAAPATQITKASWGGRQGSGYWFPRPVEHPEDHPLVILGGGRDASGPGFETYVIDDSEVNKDVGEVLREFLPWMYPGRYEKGREPEMEWVGPVVGPGGSASDEFEGQYLSAGYTGHGMPRAFAWFWRNRSVTSHLEQVVAYRLHIGRNGGHLTAEIFDHFVFRQSKYGAEEAKKAHKLEIHTEQDLVSLIKAEGWENLVDLVSSHRVGLLRTEKEIEVTKADYDAANAAGADLIEDVEWLDEKEVFELYKFAKKLNPDLKLHTNTPVTSISRDVSSAHLWSLSTPRGSIRTSYVIHATNAYASHLLPHMHGPKGIIPTREQAMALRAAAPSTELTKDAWVGTLGCKYWFPRPVSSPDENPLLILGGARDESGPGLESYIIDDSTVNVNVGRALRNYLPPLFPGKYEQGREPEMEWTGIMGITKVGDPFVSLNRLLPTLDDRFMCFKVGPVVDATQIADYYKGQYMAAGYTGHGMPRGYACAEAVVGMIVAEIAGKKWVAPEWFPRHFLTTERS